jgi:hypothetical protein
MTSKKNLAKEALKHPELFTPAELAYFEFWLRKRKERKKAKKSRIRLALERIFLL